MLKVTIQGEVYPFDPRYPLHEAIQLEEGLGMSFGAYQQGLRAGSAKALCGFVWLVLHRNGRNVPLADILSGKYEISEDEIGFEAEGEAEEGKAPGSGGGPSSTPTSGDGSPSSPPPSGTPRRRSAS